jgi:nicotinate dehydrogenase subunit A
MARISLKVNGSTRVIDTDPETPLLYVLRNELQLNGPKFGCGLGQCGACTVIMDGTIRSCVTEVKVAANRSVTTLEGLGSTKKLHRLQKAFIDEQAVQCGYCINGMIMSAKVCSIPIQTHGCPDQGSVGRKPLPLRTTGFARVKRASGQKV